MIDMDRIPVHVAVIMDGNGRWAKEKGLPRVAGHNSGMKAMKEIIKRASQLGVKFLTVYAFSTENWKRSEEEIDGIFKLLVKYVAGELKELKENNVRVCTMGDLSPLPEKARKSISKAVAETSDNTGMVFNVALNYGGRDEICRAVKRLVSSGVSPEEIDEDLIGANVYTGLMDIPDPELLIRTSGEKRLSNFMLWQTAYTEMVFTQVLWPDFTPGELDKCIEEYQSRDRRFGGRKNKPAVEDALKSRKGKEKGDGR